MTFYVVRAIGLFHEPWFTNKQKAEEFAKEFAGAMQKDRRTGIVCVIKFEFDPSPDNILHLLNDWPIYAKDAEGKFMLMKELPVINGFRDDGQDPRLR